MADADTQEQHDSGQQDSGQQEQVDLNAKFLELTEMLKQTNEKFESSIQAIQTATFQPKQAQMEQEFEDLYDPNVILKKTEQVVNQALNKERELNSTIYQMTQEYPEISSDPKIRQAVFNAYSRLPKELQGTALGYKTAALEVIAENGLLPKSKRTSVDSDISMSNRNRGPSSRPNKKSGITDEMLEVAYYMGRDIQDKEYLKRLEKATKRNYRQWE